MKKSIFLLMTFIILGFGCSDDDSFGRRGNNLIIRDEWPTLYPGTAIGILEGQEYNARVKAIVRGDGDKKIFTLSFTRLDIQGYLDNDFIIDGIKVGADSIPLNEAVLLGIMATYYDLIQTDSGCRNYLVDTIPDGNMLIFNSEVDTSSVALSGVLNARLSLEADTGCNNDGFDDYIIFENVRFEVPIREM